MSEIVRLGKFTTYGVGGESKVDILDSPTKLYLLDKKPLVIGRGANLLIADSGVECAVINRLVGVENTDDGFIARSGQSLTSLVSLAQSRSLGGLEWACGIPASVGGAIISNAGAFGREIADIVEWVEVYENGSITRLGRNEIDFSYRNSAINGFVTRAKLKLYGKDRKQIELETAKYRDYRIKTQPKGKSAGSVFKRVNGVSAGYYIEKVGLKGRRVGGAKISEKHANFILNDKDAKASDIYELIVLIENTVEKRFGIKLEREIKLYGEF
ncbi:MAG: UDP-N-acetylmuramate dehydrogenase [Clostridia bacterium]|nr:UDP-N-acetylmuramate dehydrogenase [Clostridia bacterium]